MAFYALAVVCKETYVPLVLLLPFLPRGSVDARLRSVVPFIPVVVLYVLCRSYMLRASDDNLTNFANYNTTVQEEALYIEMQFGQDFPHWKLGPYHNGEYRLVSQNIGSLFLPQSGSIPTTLQTLQLLESPFMLKYSSPHGWITFSPELSLDTTESANSARLKWERP